MKKLSFFTGKRDFLNACKLGDMDSVREFISRGGDPNVEDRSSRTGLLYAAAANRSEIVKKLIAAGAKVDHSDAGHWTALGLACKAGHIEIVKALLKTGASYSDIGCVPVKLEDQFSGGSPLMIAAAEGHSEIVMLISESLSEGFFVLDIEGRKSKWKERSQLDLALYAAASNGHVALARMLLELGADPKITLRGHEIIDHAYEQGHMEIVHLLENYGAQLPNPLNSPLVNGCRLGLVQEVERCLAQGADPNIADETGHHVLITAASAGHTSIIEMLINAGADSWSKDLGLMCAGEAGHWDAVELLLDHGANVNYTDKSGRTILMNILTPVSPFLWNSGIIRGIESLLEWGIDVNARDKRGDTALSLVIKLIKTRSTGFANDSYTVDLHDLFLKITDILLRYGADLSVTDSSGNTPMSLARKTNLKDLIHLLEAHSRKSRSMAGNHLRLVED